MDYNKNGKIDSEDLLIEESMKNNYSGNSYHGALKGLYWNYLYDKIEWLG